MTTSARDTRTWLALIVLLALVLRLALFFYVSPKPLKFYTPDSTGYEQLAINLDQRGIFSQDRHPPFSPDLDRTPVYPAMIAAVYAGTGRTPEAVVLLQVLLGAITALLAYVLGGLLRLPQAAGLTAALVVALDPVSVMNTDLLLTETLFTTLMVVGLTLMALNWRSLRLWWLMGASVVFAMAALARPVSQFLPLALAPVVLLATRARGLHIAVVATLLFLVFSMGITYSWAYRNYQASGLFTLSTVSDTNLVYYRAREVLASVEGLSQGDALKQIEARVASSASGRVLSRSETAAMERQEALTIFREHPAQTATMLIKGAGRIFADPGFTNACTLLDPSSAAMECFEGEATMDEAGVGGRIAALFLRMSPIQKATLVWSALLSAVVYLLAVLGGIKLIRDRRWFPAALLVITLGYLIVLSAGSEAYSRFRVPLVPLLAILAGMGLCSVVDRVWRNRAGEQEPHPLGTLPSRTITKAIPQR